MHTMSENQEMKNKVYLYESSHPKDNWCKYNQFPLHDPCSRKCKHCSG